MVALSGAQRPGVVVGYTAYYTPVTAFCVLRRARAGARAHGQARDAQRQGPHLQESGLRTATRETCGRPSAHAGGAETGHGPLLEQAT